MGIFFIGLVVDVFHFQPFTFVPFRKPGVTAELNKQEVDETRADLLDILYLVYILKDMWEIYEHRKLAKHLKALPLDILKRYEKWKDIVALSGPKGLKMIKGFHDESLRGEWAGHRSSRLGVKYRVIYKIRASEVLVQVVTVTAHDYKTK